MATILLYILYYTKNKYFSILQIITSYFIYADNITKCIVENLHHMDILVIYKSIQ